jgi:hypothetical protein
VHEAEAAVSIYPGERAVCGGVGCSIVGSAERNFIGMVQSITRVEARTFAWLTNTFDPDDEDISAVFRALGGDLSGLQSKRESKLRPDAFLPDLNCILEFDEVQHFTRQREIALSLYPAELKLGFDRAYYMSLCQMHQDAAMRKGAAGFRRPTAEFPFLGGRHCQRALFDTLRDILPLRNGLSPTIRISEIDLVKLGDAKSALAEVSRILRI